MFTEKQLLYKILTNLAMVFGVLIVALIGIGIFSGQISKISDSVYEKQKIALLLSRRNENLTMLKGNLARVGTADVQIENAFPTTDNILEFVSAMETLANQYGVRQTLRFGNATPLPEFAESFPLSTLDYSLTLNGNIGLLISYLEDFEKLPFITAIQSMSINAGSNGWVNESQISIAAKLYIKVK
jgi:Tfp pilus assembly protein PilO